MTWLTAFEAARPFSSSPSGESQLSSSRMIPLGGIEGPALHDPCRKEPEGGCPALHDPCCKEPEGGLFTP